MKKFNLILAFAFVIGLVGSATAQTATEVKAKFNEAAAKYNEKDFAAAIPLFEETIALTDTSEDDVLETLENSQKFLINSYYNAAMKSAQSADYDAALEGFTKCYDLASLTSNSKATSAANMIGNVYLAKGTDFAKAEQPAEAAAEFIKGYEQNKRNTKIGLLAAEYSIESGNQEKANEIYKEIIELGETHSKYADAATSAKSAFSSNYLVAAVEAAKENNYDGVLENVDSIIAVDPTNAQALLIRVQAANNMKKTDDVIKFAPEAIEAQSDTDVISNINYFLGSAYQTKENKTAAIAAYKNVVSGDNVATAKEMITALSK